MRSLISTSLSVAAGLCIAAAPTAGQPTGPSADRTAEAIQTRIEAGRAAGAWYGAGRAIRAAGAVPRFYERRGFEPVWVADPKGPARFEALLSAIRGASRHGLDPEDYHLATLDSLGRLARGRARAAAPGVESAAVDLELLASDAFMTLGSHLLMGRVNPETINPEWLANRRRAAFEDVLETAVAEDRIAGTLGDQAPRQPRYRQLTAALARVRAAAEGGGWPRVGEGEALEAGATEPRVRRLRERLTAGGDLEGEPPGDPAFFDDDLADAVRRFQARHGLTADGVVGPATVAALDVGPLERARQLEVNLERWRWLPEDLGERHIEVNIAGFTVDVVVGGRLVRRHRAVVGRRYRQTPMFSGTMTYLVLSPYWHVPPLLAAQDKLPLIKADPGYLAAERIVVFDQATNAVVDPGTVDWASLSGSELNRRYRLRQEPGPRNSLGAVKFMFPNRYSVYLHDTPARELFSRTSRAFSSGCIRTEDPLALAEYLLSDQPGWTRERIERVVGGGVEQTVRLARPVPVHLLYWTAWADEDGSIHFRDDIYGRDGVVHAALDAPPP